MSNSEIRKMAANYGLIMGVIGLVFAAVQYAVGDFSMGSSANPRQYIYSGINFIIGLVILVMAMNKLKARNGGFLPFGKGFRLGFSIYIFSAIVGIIWLMLYMYVLEPDYQAQILDASAEQIYDSNPNIGEEEFDMAMGWSEKMTGPLAMVVISIISAAFIGAIISAIVAGIISAMGNKNQAMEAEAANQDSEE
jgi:hypothetical protein